MRALDQRDGQDPTCPPPDLLHSEVLSYLGECTEAVRLQRGPIILGCWELIPVVVLGKNQGTWMFFSFWIFLLQI
jgi:hypothetical protein